MADTKALFNRAAPLWDQKEAGRDRQTIDIMLRLSNMRPGLRLLDAGCGTGVLEPFLLAYQPERIYAVDFAENMIRVAREKYTDERIEYICLDFYGLSPKRYACDLCLFYNAFPYFDDAGRVAAHAAQLLRPGGRLTISHTQGKQAADDLHTRGLPAPGLINALSPYFRLDVLVDNDVMLLVSGIRLAG
jgi:demethylmenaquinone methyltransferase/2-methoxy-6-polyprenyl-1,4-benzoquinol methylase